MCLDLINAVMASDLRQPDRAVAFVIAHRINHERPEVGCYLGVKRLSDDAGFSERAVRGSLRRLEGIGILTTEERFGRTSIFRLDLARLVERKRPESERRYRGPSQRKSDVALTPAPRAALKSAGVTTSTPAPRAPTPAVPAPTPATQVLTPARGAPTPARGAPVTGFELLEPVSNRLLNYNPTPLKKGEGKSKATTRAKPEDPGIRNRSGELTAEETEKRRADQLAKLAAITPKAASETRLGKKARAPAPALPAAAD